MKSLRLTPFERLLNDHVAPAAPGYLVGKRALMRIDRGLAKCVYFGPSAYSKGSCSMHAVVSALCEPESHVYLSHEVRSLSGLPRVEVGDDVRGATRENAGVREILKRLPVFTRSLDRIHGARGMLHDPDMWWGVSELHAECTRAYLRCWLGEHAKATRHIERVRSVMRWLKTADGPPNAPPPVTAADALSSALQAGPDSVRQLLLRNARENLRGLKLDEGLVTVDGRGERYTFFERAHMVWRWIER
ncbi:MAG TPA: hypothetical protein VEB22_02105 [Phycisphaerales bacterium]|nr:hypothetical protein [Phycisphaerales bacterium]